MKQRTQKVEDWLKDFLSVRTLDEADGRHLFAYRITACEFSDLERILQSKVQVAATFCKTVLDHWGDVPAFGALFVLYASHWWQQYYDGTSFEWKPIMDALTLPPDSWNSAEMPNPVKAGLAVWKLKPGSDGYKYLGAIAREAGLPQKLLVEYRGCVGKILKSILREAVMLNPSGDIVQKWVENMQGQLPASYRHEVVLSLLTDSINAVLHIKTLVKSTSAEEAFRELETRSPQWKDLFPLPLDTVDARELLNQLVRGVTSVSQSTAHSKGDPIRAERRLYQREPGIWELAGDLIIPETISIPAEAHIPGMPRILSLRITLENTLRDIVLRKHADNDYYFHNLDKNETIWGKEVASEVQLHFITPAAGDHTTFCPGGQELDDDLPWIFELNRQRNSFRQQGGGSVRGEAMLVALAPGWIIQPAPQATLEEDGELCGINRTVFCLTGCGTVQKPGIQFKLRTAQLENDVVYSWQGKRYWNTVIAPHMTFFGVPFPQKQAGSNTTELRTSPLSWKWPCSTEYQPVSGQLCGVVDVWYSAPSGANLRNRMLIIPESAKLHLRPMDANTGTVVLENWQANDVCMADSNETLLCTATAQGHTTELRLTSRTGNRPPEYVELYVHWAHSPHPARIRVPFPTRGARLFNRHGQEVMPDQLLCISDLMGMRLLYMPGTIHRAQLGLAFATGTHRLSFSIEASGQNHFLIRLQDWKQQLQEMLATAAKLDSLVSMCVTEDFQDVTCWRFSRYNNKLLRNVYAESLELENMNSRPAEQLGSIQLHAVCLTSPMQSVCCLDEQTSENVPVGRWLLKDQFPCNGAWLIFEPVENSTIRPVLWKVEHTGIDPAANRLEQAMAAPTEEREQHIAACMELLCQDPMAPEWKTLSQLVGTLVHLPLSTLDVWGTLCRSGRAMATLALRPDVDFVALTARASEELPFLWETVTRQQWELAGQHLRAWCRAISGEDSHQMVYRSILEDRLPKAGAHCPPINGLLHIACPLAEDLQHLDSIRAGFTLKAFRSLLYESDEGDLKTLCQRNAEAHWPTTFGPAVARARKNAAIARFLPPYQGFRESVVCFPVLLALQAYSGSDLISIPDEPFAKTLFELRQHAHFDSKWFDDAFSRSIFCCLAENFQIQEGS